MNSVCACPGSSTVSSMTVGGLPKTTPPSASPTYRPMYVYPYIIQPVIRYVYAPLQTYMYVNYVPSSAGRVLQLGIFYTGRPTLSRPVQLVAMSPVVYRPR